MTGRQGFHGNLTAAQIINQVLSVEESERLTNIVFMGMGEPMDNFEAVLAAIEVLTEPWGLAWSPRRITGSTPCGSCLTRLRCMWPLACIPRSAPSVQGLCQWRRPTPYSTC